MILALLLGACNGGAEVTNSVGPGTRYGDYPADAVLAERVRVGCVKIFSDADPTLSTVLYAPMAIQEMVMALCLIFKGFDTTTLHRRSAVSASSR